MLTAKRAAPDATPATLRRRGFVLSPIDVSIPIVLGVIAIVLRLNLPRDGLWYDDAWVAFGASKGSFTELATVGQTQPGFTFGLMVWSRLFGSGPASMVTPALIAGTLGPPALYLVLRRLRFASSIAALVASIVTVSTTHIIYSTRVKTYTSDLLLVLLLALVVPWFAARRWRVQTALAWIAGSLVVASFSSIMILATVAAGMVVVLHPRGDFNLRVVTVAAQFVAAVAFVVGEARTYNSDILREFFDDREGFLDVDPNPVRFGSDAVEHLLRVVYVFPGGPRWIAPLVLAAGAGGILVAAWRGRNVIVGRLFVAMASLGFAGAVVDRIPFGPNESSNRVSLWLVPVVAFGLAAALGYARRVVAGNVRWRAGFDGIVFASAALVLVTAVSNDSQYVQAGARSATRQVMAELGPRDEIWVTRPTTYSFALYAQTPVSLRETPDRVIGFLPRFSDPRVHMLDLAANEEDLQDLGPDVDRVYVVHADVGSSGYGRWRFALALNLIYRGFERQTSERIEATVVDMWRRPAG